jgi:hypothetical protein
MAGKGEEFGRPGSGGASGPPPGAEYGYARSRDPYLGARYDSESSLTSDPGHGRPPPGSFEFGRWVPATAACWCREALLSCCLLPCRGAGGL